MRIIYSPDTESNCISALLRHPEIFADISAFITEDDFQSKIHRNIFGIIKTYITRNQEVNITLIANKINNLGISFEGLQCGVFDFLEGLQSVSQINAFVGVESFKELKRITVRREIAQVGQKIQEAMYGEAKDMPIEKIISMADLLYAGKISLFEQEGKDFDNIYEGMERFIEEQEELSEYGMQGPFKRVNEVYGSLVLPGNITVIGARSKAGKTTLGFDFLTHIQQRYNVPMLHIDHGEMTKEELMYRAVSRFTNGKVSPYLLQTGQWRKYPEIAALVRAVWPIVSKLDTSYENIGGKSEEEVESIIRRFYLRKVGRNGEGLIHFDYLKPFDDDFQSNEWKAMGHFIQHIKTLITTKNGVRLPFWTSLQLNKKGIVTNKRANQLEDSEDSFGISDRIIQQSSHGILLRKKTMDEVVMEPGLGNMKFKFIVARHLGQMAEDHLNPVKMKDGSFQDNYIFLESKGFCFTEIGDLKTLRNKIRIPETEGDVYENVDDVNL